ncbi:MAG: phosphate ABC transporter substrate-binding protein [Betaproteobacteria bacterium HGW-Betaproteobacteria-12]|nr:MAG: phosphate ABC transporter substrate-binding protein [Betaproteobacteria bacterium HGW-Betaproteobacteria-12]
MKRLPICALATLLLLTAAPPALATGTLAVVVNARCGVAVLTRNEVINIFFGRYRQFFNGREAHPVDLVDGHPARGQFYRRLVGKDLSEINAYWSRQIFSGRLQALNKVATPEEVAKWVAANPCGIGFIEQAKVDARFNIVYELAP